MTKFVNKQIMLDRQKTILTAAWEMFARYGFKRTTMNDIASQAGVARQTLYNAFDNKEAILRALIQLHIEETCTALAEHAAQNGSLPDGLELAFDHFARKPYELLVMTPHGGELMEELENSASTEMTESKQRFSTAMAEMLAPHIPKGVATELRAEALADFIVHTAMGHKTKAASQEHLENLLGTLKAVVLRVL